MNFGLQDPGCMMLSSSVPPSSTTSTSHSPLPQHPLHRGLPGQVVQGPHISYEGRVSVLPNSGYSSGMPHLAQHFPQTPFSGNLNLNLFNSAAFKGGKEENEHQHHPFNFPFPDRDSSPSSTESPRTSNDEQPHDGSISNNEESPRKPMRELSEDNVESPESKSEDIPPLQFIKEAVEKTEVDLNILRPVMREAQDKEDSIIEEEPEALQVTTPVRGLEIRPIGGLVNDDRKRKREEESIELEMEEEDANESMMEHSMNESGEERNESMEKSSEGNEEHTWKPFQGFQPYLNVKEEEGTGPANALEKLQQVLDSRMFEGRKGPVANGGNGGEAGEPVEQPNGEDSEYKFILPPDEEGMVYQCHICSYTGNSRYTFNIHVNTHYNFQCAKCDFEDKSESVYVKHLHDEHNCTPLDLEEAEIRTPRVNSQGKVKTFKCKQCEFVAVTKLEFWTHCRGHIKPEKMLFCPKCIFVTEYKHHLEYHLRNHYGAKPFKCSHCNYSCVNKSMLNSHMKSHTNVYQYRCADCTYATKYCHSLKLHLRKYSHKPAMVLNNDGSPNPLPVIDAFGNRRGPKNKKGEEGGLFPPSLLPNFPSPFSMPSMAQLQQLQQNMNGNNLKIAQVHPFMREPESRSPFSHERSDGSSPPDISSSEEQLRCDKCEFKTSSREVYKNHVMLHESMSPRGTTPNNNMSALHHLLTKPLPPRHHPDLNRSRDEMSSPGGTFSPKQPSPTSPRTLFPGRPYQDRPESPTSSSPGMPKLPQMPQLPPHLSYLNRFAMAQPFLKNLVPNPTIQAIMESRNQIPHSSPEPIHLKSESPEVQPASPPQSPPRTEAPLPPNKRSRQDIFAALYESRLSEMREKQEQGVLDLSKEQGLGGGSHGSSSSDVDSGSNPRSHSSSPALSSTNSQEQSKGKSRRKGKAFKITRMERDSDDEVSTSESPAMPSLMAIPKHASGSPQEGEEWAERTTCKFCGIAFKNAVMFTIHMGYHGYQSPFKCNMCGDENSDPVSFFLHIARKEHH